MLKIAYTISIILIFLNAIFLFFKKRGKFISFILVLFMWTLFWSNTMNPDYINYLRAYNFIESGASVLSGSGMEFGYKALMKMGVVFGLNFEIFLAILVAFSYFLIHSTVKRYCKNYNYIYLIYFIFPFFLDVVQVRNFVAMSIFIYAIQYLFESSIKSKFKYIILILLATTIHKTAIFYLPMILINTKKKNMLIKGIALFSLLGSLVILANNKRIPFIGEFVEIILGSELNWFKNTTNWGFLLFWFMQSISFLMALYANYLMTKYSKYTHDVNDTKGLDTITHEKSILFVKLIYWINLLAFIYLPFYLLASTFTRLMRNILLLNYISFAIVSENIKRRDIKLFFNTIVILYVLFFFIIDLYLPYKETVIDSILKNNLFMGR